MGRHSHPSRSAAKAAAGVPGVEMENESSPWAGRSISSSLLAATTSADCDCETRRSPLVAGSVAPLGLRGATLTDARPGAAAPDKPPGRDASDVPP